MNKLVELSYDSEIESENDFEFNREGAKNSAFKQRNNTKEKSMHLEMPAIPESRFNS